VTPDSETSAARRAVTVAVLAVALFAAVVIQLTVVNRLPLPGSASPDLVLLLVTAIAVFTGPTAGAVSGFAGGLALDVAPPAAHYAGEYALVFCLAGYAAARVARAIRDVTGERDPVVTFTVMAAAAVAGEAGKAALGLLLSDPHVTPAAAGRVLPAAILYDLLLAPFVCWLVSWALRAIRSWGTAPEHAPLPEFSRAQRLTLVFRQASAGAAPDLRLAGTGGNYQRRAPARPLPRLRLSGAPSPATARTRAAATSGATFPVAGARATKLNFAGDLAVGTGGSGRRANSPGKNWLRGPRTLPARGRGGQAAAPRSPGRGWLSSAARTGPGQAAAPRSPGRGWLSSAGQRGAGRRGRAAGLAGRPRSADAALAARSAPSGVSALSGAATPLGRRSPQAGWLRGGRSAASSLTPSRRLAPRRGWLGGRRRRTVIGSGVSGRAAFRRGSIAHHNWYTASPSGTWLRRSRHPWRARRQRLLRKVGVGR
jgi:rod shape-determining protein MreD